MDMGTVTKPAALVLAELALFWGVALLHMIRLLSATHRTPGDRLEDAAHMAMDAGMTLMVFPGIPLSVLRTSAVVFAVCAAAVFTHGGYSRSGHRCQNAAITVGLSAMAYMLAAPAHPPAWLPTAVAGLLAVCALAHGWQLVGAWNKTSVPAASRVLLTLPHAGTLIATAAMAWLVAAA